MDPNRINTPDENTRLIAVIHTNRDGRMIDIEPAIRPFLQGSPGTLAGSHIARLISSQVPRAVTDTLYNKMAQGKSFSGYLLLGHTARHSQWAFVSATPEYRDDQLNGFCLICRQAPAASLQEIESLYHQLRQLETDPLQGQLASQLHIRRWASHLGRDPCQAMRQLFRDPRSGVNR